MISAISVGYMAPEEISRYGKPVIIKLTPGIILLVGSFFVTVLTATVFVVRIDDQLASQERTLTAVLAGQARSDSVRAVMLHEQAVTRERLREIERLTRLEMASPDAYPNHRPPPYRPSEEGGGRDADR